VSIATISLEAGAGLLCAAFAFALCLLRRRRSQQELDDGASAMEDLKFRQKQRQIFSSNGSSGSRGSAGSELRSPLLPLSASHRPVTGLHAGHSRHRIDSGGGVAAGSGCGCGGGGGGGGGSRGGGGAQSPQSQSQRAKPTSARQAAREAARFPPDGPTEAEMEAAEEQALGNMLDNIRALKGKHWQGKQGKGKHGGGGGGGFRWGRRAADPQQLLHVYWERAESTHWELSTTTSVLESSPPQSPSQTQRSCNRGSNT
jgi:hypothetical protein